MQSRLLDYDPVLLLMMDGGAPHTCLNQNNQHPSSPQASETAAIKSKPSNRSILQRQGEVDTEPFPMVLYANAAVMKYIYIIHPIKVLCQSLPEIFPKNEKSSEILQHPGTDGNIKSIPLNPGTCRW